MIAGERGVVRLVSVTDDRAALLELFQLQVGRGALAAVDIAGGMLAEYAGLSPVEARSAVRAHAARTRRTEGPPPPRHRS